MPIKYFATYHNSYVTEVEIQVEYDKHVRINNQRVAKKGIWNGYFNSWENAHEFCVMKQEELLREAKRHVLYRENELARVKALRKGDPEGFVNFFTVAKEDDEAYEVAP